MGLNMYCKTACKFAGGAIGVMLLGIGLEELLNHFTRYDKEGFDANGFDRDGFDRSGYDAEGYDRSGFDINGFDKAGYDCHGYDREGYNRKGFACDGFNHEGLDYQGYGRDYYNCAGIDRAGCCRQFYASYIERLRERLHQAFQQMQYGEYRYALCDARLVLEEALKLLVQHVGGQTCLGDKLLENLKICEKKQLLEIGFIDRLHGVRKICNINWHEFGADEQLSHNKVYFVIMQVSDLLNESETLLVHL